MIKLIDKIKLLFCKLLYNKESREVMSALTNDKAYKSYKLTMENHEKVLRRNLQSLIRSLDQTIDLNVEKGLFMAEETFESSKFNKEQQKYLINYYKKEGYKVKIKKSDNPSGLYNKRIIILWNY